MSQGVYCLAMPPQHTFFAWHSFSIILWRIEPHSLSKVCAFPHSRILLLHLWQTRDLLVIRHWCHQFFLQHLCTQAILLVWFYCLKEMSWCHATHQITLDWECVNLIKRDPPILLVYTLLHNNIANNPIKRCLKDGHQRLQATTVRWSSFSSTALLPPSDLAPWSIRRCKMFSFNLHGEPYP